MNTLQEKIEKEVIALIFRDYPDLRDQIIKARITSRKFTGVGFFTRYDKEDVLWEEEMIISDVGAIINNTEVGFVFFLRKESDPCLECYTYGEPFPDQIESYELYVYVGDKNYGLTRSR